MPRGSCIPFFAWLAALAVPAVAAAQSNVVTPSPPPREGTVGPEQLRDFALPGTTTRPTQPANDSAPPAATAPAPQADEPARRPAAPATTTPTQPRPSVTTPVTEVVRAQPTERATERSAAPAPQVSLGLEPSAGSAEPSFTPTFTPPPAPVASDGGSSDYPPAPASPPSPMSWWPWVLAALVAGVAAFVVLRRQRAQEDVGRLAFAGGGAAEAPSAPPARPVAAPRPAPAPVQPRAAPAPQPAPSGTIRAFAPKSTTQPSSTPAPPRPAGLVSSRLRPWIEIELTAERAVLTDEEMIIHFEVAILNSGSVPARNVVVEAMAINAGSGQDGEIATFYARPDMDGAGVESVPPLGRVALRNMVRMPRGAMREYVAEGRTLLVPIVAFNAGYRWSGGQGRSGAAFLVGRGGEDAEKMGPLRLDLGPREFRPLTQRRLETAVRR